MPDTLRDKRGKRDNSDLTRISRLPRTPGTKAGHLTGQSAALRLARHRERRAAGRACFTIEADEIAPADTLAAAKLLDPNNADNQQAIAAALQRLLDTIISEAVQRVSSE